MRPDKSRVAVPVARVALDIAYQAGRHPADLLLAAPGVAIPVDYLQVRRVAAAGGAAVGAHGRLSAPHNEQPEE